MLAARLFDCDCSVLVDAYCTDVTVLQLQNAYNSVMIQPFFVGIFSNRPGSEDRSVRHVLCFTCFQEKIMDDRLKETADEIQAAILKEAQEIYSRQVIERWLNPVNWGALEEPDGFSKITGPCGDTMQIGLKIANGRISEVKYVTDGCATSIASGSMATGLAQGKTLEEGLNISRPVILEALGGLPEESEHCALLASTTLQTAIQNYLKGKTSREQALGTHSSGKP